MPVTAVAVSEVPSELTAVVMGIGSGSTVSVWAVVLPAGVNVTVNGAVVGKPRALLVTVPRIES